MRMIIIAAILIGAAFGWFRASKLGGQRYDKLQYAAGYALAWAALGVFVTVLIDRMI